MIVQILLTIFMAPLELIYWIKWIVAYLAIRCHIVLRSKKFDHYDIYARGDPVKVGYIVPESEKDLESPFPESHIQEKIDENLFYGTNSKLECLLVRVSRGPNQTADSWVYLKMANGKTYNLSETTGYQQPSEGNERIFSCGKLQMYYLSPMRRWRIFYCGMLKETSGDKAQEVFVKFAFLWKASSDAWELSLENNPEGFASAMARSDWKTVFDPPIKRFTEAFDNYAQTGAFSGTISVDNGTEYEMYLFGEKIRRFGKSESMEGCKYSLILGNIPLNGFKFHLLNASIPHICKNLPAGFVVGPEGDLQQVKELEINMKPMCAGKDKTSFKAYFKTGEQYRLSGHIAERMFLYSGQGWGGFIELSFIEFTIEDKKGSGIFLSGEVYEDPNRIEKSENDKVSECLCNVVIDRNISVCIPLTVLFTDKASQLGEISGGKGSSLGKLTRLNETEKSFIVPKGILVSTSAYKDFLTPRILDAVKYLENVAYGKLSGDLKEACSKVSAVVENTPLPNKVCFSIVENLQRVFRDGVNEHKFAVQSSATGEDIAAISAAGHMDTFLGVQSFEDIFIAVKKCWASQFGHIAIECKRRYGQELNSPMAVVIQEMVDCEVFGNIFTCDPVTHNPSLITITANYGFGEAVVSGFEEPDTFILRRRESCQLELESVFVGQKQQKIILQNSVGVVSDDIDGDSRIESCLSIEAAEYLGKIALKIEKFYRTSRIIEWGISNNQIYILQSRPVTNIAAETENEILHEFDPPLMSERECFTTLNIGEVFSEPLSPLGIEISTKFLCTFSRRNPFGQGMKDPLFQNKYQRAVVRVFNNRMMVSLLDRILRYGVDTPNSKAFMISWYGRILDDPELLSQAREQSPKNPVELPLRIRLLQYWDLYYFDSGIKELKKKVENYELSFLKEKTAKETFKALIHSCSDFDEAAVRHLKSIDASSNWNMEMFKILWSAKGNLNADVYSDFTTLLASSYNVEGGSIQQEMQAVANQITKDIGHENFKSMSEEDAENWLQTTNLRSGKLFQEFLKKHGHRCLQEYDVHSITWRMNPRLLVKLLQNLPLAINEMRKREKSFDEIFSELNVPLNFISKCFLKIVLPYCRRGFRARQDTKLISVKAFDHWRRGYRHQGKLMVAEGRLPDEDLLFFLTLDEIQELLNTRSPSIISRANNRRRFFPTLHKLRFPEIMKGVPKPINEEEESANTYEFEADLTMRGLPVSQGVTKGYARIAKTLKEASSLKPGEILITYSTDIGWSPYFPIISGIGAEYGGLILPGGGVVSREYGLPCVVGLEGATKRFHTGDYVLLDGKKGVLQRLREPDKTSG